jgi:transposase
VLCKGVSRRDVPTEQIGRSGVTAWRRLRDRTEAGVWPQLHEVLLAELRAAGLLEIDDAAIDGSHVRALKGGLTPDFRRLTGPGPAASTTCSSTGRGLRLPSL